MNLDYATVFSLAPFINEDIIVLIGICLLIGAMAKSSQLGSWKAHKEVRYDSASFSTLLNAGKIPNTLESKSSNCIKFHSSLFDLGKSQRQGINQQDLKKLTTIWIKKKLNELDPVF